MCPENVHTFVSKWQMSENNLLMWLPLIQVSGYEPFADPRGLHHRCPASVQPAGGPVTGPEEAVPALPGPHAVHWRRSQNGHQRVSVPVQTPALELQHGGQLLCFWSGHANR